MCANRIQIDAVITVLHVAEHQTKKRGETVKDAVRKGKE